MPTVETCFGNRTINEARHLSGIETAQITGARLNQARMAFAV